MPSIDTDPISMDKSIMANDTHYNNWPNDKGVSQATMFDLYILIPV